VGELRALPLPGGAAVVRLHLPRLPLRQRRVDVRSRTGSGAAVPAAQARSGEGSGAARGPTASAVRDVQAGEGDGNWRQHLRCMLLLLGGGGSGGGQFEAPAAVPAGHGADRLQVPGAGGDLQHDPDRGDRLAVQAVHEPVRPGHQRLPHDPRLRTPGVT
jgi:hypothetical protein